MADEVETPDPELVLAAARAANPDAKQADVEANLPT
jgi:hypothetical protein